MGPESTIGRPVSPGLAGLRPCLILKRPVPGLINEAEIIVSGDRSWKNRNRRILGKPGKCIGIFEFLGQRPAARRCNIDGGAGVVLAESRCSVDRQNFLDGLPGRILRRIRSAWYSKVRNPDTMRRRMPSSLAASAILCQQAAADGVNDCIRPTRFGPTSISSRASA